MVRLVGLYWGKKRHGPSGKFSLSRTSFIAHGEEVATFRIQCVKVTLPLRLPGYPAADLKGPLSSEHAILGEKPSTRRALSYCDLFFDEHMLNDADYLLQPTIALAREDELYRAPVHNLRRRFNGC